MSSGSSSSNGPPGSGPSDPALPPTPPPDRPSEDTTDTEPPVELPVPTQVALSEVLGDITLLSKAQAAANALAASLTAPTYYVSGDDGSGIWRPAAGAAQPPGPAVSQGSPIAPEPGLYPYTGVAGAEPYTALPLTSPYQAAQAASPWPLFRRARKVSASRARTFALHAALQNVRRGPVNLRAMAPSTISNTSRCRCALPRRLLQLPGCLRFTTPWRARYATGNFSTARKRWCGRVAPPRRSKRILVRCLESF